MSFFQNIYAEVGTLIAAFTLIALLVLSSVIGFAPNKWRRRLMLLIVLFAGLNAVDFYLGRIDQKSTEQKVSTALLGLETRLEAATNKMQELSSSLEKTGAQLTGIDRQSRSIQADLDEARTALNEIPKLTSDLGIAITTLQGRIDQASQDTSKGLNQLSKETARQRSILKCQDEERVRSNSLYGSSFRFGTTPCAE